MGRGKPDTADAVKDRIRGAGLRCTAARVAVLQHLETAPGPLTHAEVSEALHHLGFDRATIYRNLTELTEAKLAARVELGDHVWRFEAKRAGGGHKGDDHPHFVCTTCGEVSCLDDVQVAITPRSAAGKSAPGTRKAGRSPAASGRIGSVTEILLKGRCEQCD
jgi:Fur family ferric uptake transcriptional regulator